MNIITIKKIFRNVNFERKVINNIFWLFFDKLIRVGLYLLLLGKIAAFLKAKNFGILNYAITLTALFNPFASLGLDNISIKYLLIDKNVLETLSTTFYLKLIGAFFAFSCCIFFAYLSFSAYSLNFICILIIAVSLLLTPFDIFEIYFQSQIKARISAIARLLVFVIASIIKLQFINEEKSLQSFVWVTLFEIVANYLIIGLIFSKYYNFKFLKIGNISIRKAKDMLNQSWSLLVSAISISLYMKVDQIMLGKISHIELGYYSAAIKLSEVWCVIPVIICSTLYPILLNKNENIESKYISKIQMLFDILFFISFSICIGTTFFASSIIGFIYKSEFYPSILILKIHIWSIIFVFLGIASNYVLLIEGKTKLILYTTLLGLFSNVVLNIILLPKYGGIGAAWATFVSYMIAVLSVIFFSKTNSLYFYNLFNFRQKVKYFLYE